MITIRFTRVKAAAIFYPVPMPVFYWTRCHNCGRRVFALGFRIGEYLLAIQGANHGPEISREVQVTSFADAREAMKHRYRNLPLPVLEEIKAGMTDGVEMINEVINEKQNPPV